MTDYLSRIQSPDDLKALPKEALDDLADEIRQEILEVVSENGGHLGSNLGAVELTIALHRVFDLKKDRCAWDVSHQAYAHKLLTGRRDRFHTLRRYGGISGFTDPKESPYDLYRWAHAGTAISTMLGLATGDEILGNDRRVIAVAGDAALASGIALEGLNNGGGLKKNLLVILNDNEWSISKSVGAMSHYLNRLRMAPIYREAKREVREILERIPVLGQPVKHGIEHMLEAAGKVFVPGYIFHELGYAYYGPIDGHDLDELIEALTEVRDVQGPVLLHVLTEKGKGYEPASEHPERLHSAKGFLPSGNGGKIEVTERAPEKKAPLPSYTKVFADALIDLARRDPKVVGITAAMPSGTGLHAFGREFPDRYHDVGICEQHGTAFASGLNLAGLKPVAAIYSTFLQRAFDQVFHEVCLNDRPVLFAMDRAGLVGNDGPTHHGVYDISYLRIFPGMVLMAPMNGVELARMLDFGVDLGKPAGLRYPRGSVPDYPFPEPEPLRLGKSMTLREGSRVAIFAYGTMVLHASVAADELAKEGVEVTLVNARFAKPLDTERLLELHSGHEHLVTVEDHVRTGGLGAAVLETLADRGADTRKLHRLALPDRFVTHGDRDDLYREVGLDPQGIAEAIRAILAGARPGEAPALAPSSAAGRDPAP